MRWLTNTGPGNFVLLLTLLIAMIVLPVAFAVLSKDHFYYGLGPGIPTLIGASIAMTMRCGHPRNWWSPFFGHDIVANRNKLSDRERSGECADAIRAEIQSWVQNCSKGSWIQVNPYRYKFLRKGDAAFFKLAWG